MFGWYFLRGQSHTFPSFLVFRCQSICGLINCSLRGWSRCIKRILGFLGFNECFACPLGEHYHNNKPASQQKKHIAGLVVTLPKAMGFPSSQVEELS